MQISQVGICSSIVGIQLTGSIVWLIVDPPQTTVQYPSRTEAVLSCKATATHLILSLAFNMLLIVLCTVYAWRTRKIPENFNETKYIGFTMYDDCLVEIILGYV
jgi:hypothetical protein